MKIGLSSKEGNGRLLVNMRRISQIACFLLFFWMLGAGAVRLSVNPFFAADPLVALVNAVTGRTLAWGALWTLLVLIPTVLLGRIFCGWMCPFGSLNHFLGYCGTKSRPRAGLVSANRYRKWQKSKYLLAITGLAAALLGSNFLAWFDPLSVLVRSTSIHLLPAAASRRYAVVPQPHYVAGLALVLLFALMLALNFRVTRFWCRALCPLGALLGAVARFSPLKLHKNQATCNGCGRCLGSCQGGADPQAGESWRKAECHLCFNCVAACPKGSLRFYAAYPRSSTRPSLSHRSALAAAATGFVALPIARAAHGGGSLAIRPPGAQGEPEFVARCIRCGECMRVCPSHALQPSVAEGGLAGFWSPALAPRVGYCEPDCVLCTEVCPTGAIARLSSVQKGWRAGPVNGSAPVRIGLAVYDRARCLPWAGDSECAVCVEWCPISPKAIDLRAVSPIDAAGQPLAVKRPFVDPLRCVGCGACEYACPLEVAAVRISRLESSRRGN